MMWEDVRLEEEDIVLRKARYEDWEPMLRNLWSHPESARYMLWEPTFTEEEARDRIGRTLIFEQKEKYGLFIYERKSGEAIGFAGMREVRPGVFEEMGIAVGPAFTRRGYGGQALRALLREAFGTCGAQKFLYSWRTRNTPSYRMQKSAGFTFSGNETRVDLRDRSEYVLCHSELTREAWADRGNRPPGPAAS